MEIIGYKVINPIEGFNCKTGDIVTDKKYFPLYKNNKDFEPVLKQETIMKTTAQTFKITSTSKALLEAMWKELVAAGYTPGVYGGNFGGYISTNETKTSRNETIDEFKQLFSGDVKVSFHKTFNLPEQYNEALAFAIEQLSPKHWEVKVDYKKDDYVVVVLGDTYNYGNSRGVVRPEVDKIYKIHSTDSSWTRLAVPAGGYIAMKPEGLRLATAKEVEDYEMSLLIEKAKKDYPKGTIFLNTSRIKVESSGVFYVTNGKVSTDGNYVYHDGKWATKLSSSVIIKGYDAIIEGDKVAFGCQVFPKTTVKDLKRLLELGIITSEYKSEIETLNNLI